MALVMVGIDEAGYGPMLGPLCVGMCALRVRDWQPGEPAPDVWSMLSTAVCRRAGDKRGRIAIEDSKKLKLANDSPRHPLVHLERGVLAMLATTGIVPTNDEELLLALGAKVEPHAWYAVEPAKLPCGNDAGMIGIDANRLTGAMESAGVELLALRCGVVGETQFNATVRAKGTKAATTAISLGEHLRWVWQQFGMEVESGGPRVVCDRQGGRTAYANYIAELMPTSAKGREPISVMVIDESDAQSRYEVVGPKDDPRRMSVMFRPEAETAHLPVALASMAAKLVRELMMGRFNRYWAARAAEQGQPELKPTAGYVQDARRWLSEAKQMVNNKERQAMVRIA